VIDVTEPLIDRLYHRLVVSCQAYPGEPMRDPAIMAAVAESVVRGGAAAVRVQGLDDIREVRRRLTVPVIGLVKVDAPGVFITPTVADAVAVATAGADVVALDGTRRRRPDGRTLSESVLAVHERGLLAMADCGSSEDAAHAVEAGADLIGTTLSGYTDERPGRDGPDLELVRELVARFATPVVAEGRVRDPDDVAACLAAGAHCVVVGTAITHPERITRRFVAALDLPPDGAVLS
jgi:N-acylglucosamine-6-phosphate 2-epimerase